MVREASVRRCICSMQFQTSLKPRYPKEITDMDDGFIKTMAVVAAAALTLLPTGPAFADGSSTATPIKHLVVIFQENVSFDHYFGTYPNALNPAGEPTFNARRNTPTVNGLNSGLLSNNPNLNPLNGPGATNSFRLYRSQAATIDQGHCYKPEQQTLDTGLMTFFPLF